MKRNATLNITLTSMFAALICVATMLIRVPIPATGGYANLGDGVILLCAYMMNPLYAIVAAGLGSMLADLLAGYMSYAAGTLIIKAGVALIGALLYNRFGRGQSEKKSLAVIIGASLLAEIFMVAGYFIYEAVFLGMGIGAAGAIVGNIGQGVVGMIVATVLTPVLHRSHELRELMEKTRP